MKISGPNGVGSAGGPQRAASRDAGGFSAPGVSEASDTGPVARTASAVGVSSIDALLAMQQVEGPLERRRKAVRRAGAILDVLDEVKLALLDGGVPARALERLMAAVRQERGGADEPRLQALLDEVETRAAVELAKLEVARTS
jgi:hypothetical protein